MIFFLDQSLLIGPEWFGVLPEVVVIRFSLLLTLVLNACQTQSRERQDPKAPEFDSSRPETKNSASDRSRIGQDTAPSFESSDVAGNQGNEDLGSAFEPKNVNNPFPTSPTPFPTSTSGQNPPAPSNPPFSQISSQSLRSVTFRIPAGTGRGPWNQPNNPIRAKVGQTLVIYNDDSIQHWLHTNFGQFTSHPGSGINPGQSASYSIANTNARGLHDHNTGGAIYMEISP